MKDLKQSRVQILPILFLLFGSTQSFAICDHERSERDQFKKNFDYASKTANVACAAGSVFTIMTFGASLAPCAAAGLAAENQRRILKEKEAHLSHCEDTWVANQRRASELAIQKTQRIKAIQIDYDIKRQQVLRDYELRIQDVLNEFASEGYDLTHPDIQTEIKDNQTKLQEEFNQVLNLLEEQKNREIAGI